MSKISEWVGLIPKAISNPEKIIEGMLNSVKNEFKLLPEDEQEEIVRRRLICNSCPLMSLNATTSEEYKTLYGENYKTDRTDLHCSCCGCNIQLKTSSFGSNCGLETYNTHNQDNVQKLKWTIYKKQENGN